MMQPAESNPFSHSSPLEQTNLPDKSSQPAFWTELEASLGKRREAGLHRQAVVSVPIGPTTLERDGKRAVHFGANDYLGLAWHPDVRRAILDAATGCDRFGSGASPLVTGHSPSHDRLVQTIATFEATERAIVFASGYAANVGTVAALVSNKDVLFSDSLNHASLIDGCRLSRAETHIYPHCDFESLRELVKEYRHRGRHAFVLSDSVFSMDGDTAPLREIHTLCHEFDMQCILDEAHATGVYGQLGRGLVEHLGLSRERIVSIGTLSKAIGCVGGFVAGSSTLIDWLTNHARSWIYSTAAPLPTVTAACKAISLVQGMQKERQVLAQKGELLRASLRELGLEVGEGSSPIVPIYVRDDKRTTELSRRLLEAGIYIPAIRSPTVPANSSLLRISLSVLHSDEEIERCVNAIRRFI